MIMTVDLDNLAAIYHLAKGLTAADGEVKDEEIKPLWEFFQTFGEMSSGVMHFIISNGDKMSFEQACTNIAGLDEGAKQQISNLFAKIVCADGDLTEDERDLYCQIGELCGLPGPETAEETEEAPEDAIIPAFILVNYYGIATIKQSEHEDWNTLGDEIASWMGCDRVEVVRYTPALNAISEKLNLNARHIVFMVARNGYGDKTVGDNMPATLLYGGGYPLVGNIVIALETDNGYEIEGFITQHILDMAFEEVNKAVDGLIRME